MLYQLEAEGHTDRHGEVYHERIVEAPGVAAVTRWARRWWLPSLDGVESWRVALYKPMVLDVAGECVTVGMGTTVAAGEV